ncbi:HslU--HslV peptidase ATPase subunit, partial [Methylobacterium sp. A54F]
LVEVGIGLRREDKRRAVKVKAEAAAEGRILDALVGPTASQPTRDSFRRKLRNSEPDDKEVEIELAGGSPAGLPMFEIPGVPGASMGAINIGDML